MQHKINIIAYLSGKIIVYTVQNYCRFSKKKNYTTTSSAKHIDIYIIFKNHMDNYEYKPIDLPYAQQRINPFKLFICNNNQK